MIGYIRKSVVFLQINHCSSFLWNARRMSVLRLTDVTYEQTTAKPKKGKTEPTPKLNGGGSSSGDDGL